MKLKKAYVYLLSFASLAFLFSACYYLSYQHALQNFNKRAIERNEDFSFVDMERSPTSILAAGEDNSVAAGTHSSDVIKPNIDYILEIHNQKTDSIDTQTMKPPGHLVGLTRNEVEQYLSDYMKDLTLSEYNKGLLSFELISFSDQEVKLRKTYDEDLVPYRFYVVVKNGFVIVYNSDLKSVYRYTHIEAKRLPEEDRIALSIGIYVNNEDELYSLLESYTS